MPENIQNESASIIIDNDLSESSSLLTNEQKNFLKQLETIEKKLNPGEEPAIDGITADDLVIRINQGTNQEKAIGMLYDTFNDAFDDYFSKKTTYREFRRTCKNSLADTAPLLENQNDWDNEFRNLRLALGNLDIAYINPDTLTDEAHKNIIKQLDLLEKEADVLRKNGHHEAADSAVLLSDIVTDTLDDYLKKRITAKEFKGMCVKAIENARPIVDKHNHLKQILTNLGLAIALLVIGYVIAVAVHKIKTNHFFFSRSHTARVLDASQESVEQASAPTVNK